MYYIPDAAMNVGQFEIDVVARCHGLESVLMGKIHPKVEIGPICVRSGVKLRRKDVLKSVFALLRHQWQLDDRASDVLIRVPKPEVDTWDDIELLVESSGAAVTRQVGCFVPRGLPALLLPLALHCIPNVVQLSHTPDARVNRPRDSPRSQLHRLTLTRNTPDFAEMTVFACIMLERHQICGLRRCEKFHREPDCPVV
jgi:hypothetical protein